MEPSHKHFRNAACTYFPCHPVADDGEFNCLFCFCPLYMLPDCGGDFVLRGKVKDCTPCTKPHGPGGYEHVLARLKRWYAEQREGGSRRAVPFHPDAHHRRSIRLPGYDYRLGGAYFVTICTHAKQCLLGEAAEGEMRLNESGRIVAAAWDWLATQYPYVSLDASIVMPNHLHGIIVLQDIAEAGPQEGGSRTAPTRKPLGRLIAAFKTVSSKAVNALPEPPAARLWQRNYFEHIIRSPQDLRRIRSYIASNPARWPEDPENPIIQANRPD